MANTTGDNRKTDKHFESTWGATDEAKALWEEQHGDKARKATAKANKDAEKDQA